ncbi:hypothetical protein SRIMM317S_03153 [Streptomyces rimosus subsp. rimosus]
MCPAGGWTRTCFASVPFPWAGARVGHRSTLMPGAVLGPGAELAPGGCLDGIAPAGEAWAGSPARPAEEEDARTAGSDWPASRPPRSRRWAAAYALTLGVLPVLPLLAALPALAGVYVLVRDCATLSDAALRLFAAAPAIAVVTTVCWILLVAAVVRLLGRGIRPGTYPVRGPVAWRAWLVTRLLNGTRSSLFPLYASLATPMWAAAARRPGRPARRDLHRAAAAVPAHRRGRCLPRRRHPGGTVRTARRLAASGHRTCRTAGVRRQLRDRRPRPGGPGPGADRRAVGCARAQQARFVVAGAPRATAAADSHVRRPGPHLRAAAPAGAGAGGRRAVPGAAADVLGDAGRSGTDR